MLSERERRVLEDIEHQLTLDDPAFVLAMRGVTRRKVGWRRPLAAALTGAWFMVTLVCLVSGAWEVAVVFGSTGIAAGLVLLVDRIARHRVEQDLHAHRAATTRRTLYVRYRVRRRARDMTPPTVA